MRVQMSMSDRNLNPSLVQKARPRSVVPIHHDVTLEDTSITQTAKSYLGRYVHRTALSNKSLLSCDAESVTFSYRDSRDGQQKTMRLPGYEFLRRFLQHTPTKGLHRVRAFGLLHSVHRATLRRVQLSLGYTASAADADEAEKKCRAPRCPYCKQQTLRRVQRLSAKQCIVHVVRPAKADPIARAPPVAARGAA